jgi:ATP-binding cassette subfamily C protein LapB
MLGGLITPLEGALTLDSYNYTAIPQTELRRTVAFVPQDGFFFKGSIRQNILLGRTDISDDAIEKAIQVSGLDLVIQQTAEGLDTEVGEYGCRLSGGQKQAISLARAIVSDPQIIIFDEPTNGMDSALEARVTTELNKYIEDKTFIMVTHRTTLLPLVNKLLLLDAGQVLAYGPRDELIQKLNMKS